MVLLISNIMIRFLLHCLLICPVLPGIRAGDVESEPSSDPAVESPAPSPAVESARKRVLLIPVRQEIFHPQLFLLRRGVEKAMERKVDAVVLLMDTPGGSVDIMRKMVNPIIDLGIPTYTLVEGEAISAGAIIAMSTDKIYMTPRATIGDAMPVIMGPNGFAELGEAEREKIESYMDAIVRSIAQAKGRNELLIRAMVRREIEFILEDGTVISPKGNILTLTHLEAERILPDGSRLLSEGTVADLDEMLKEIGLADAERIEVIPSMADDLALWITRLAPLLMGLAMLLFYLELQSPGIGWAGGTGLAVFLVLVFGHNVAGLAGMEDLVLIAIGMILLLVELLVLPGFGIAGLAGMVLMGWGLISAMTLRYPGQPGDLPGLVNVEYAGDAVRNLGLAVIGSVALLLWAVRYLHTPGFLGGRLVLRESLPDTRRDEGLAGLRALVGAQGLALTPLTPSGTVRLGETEYDAVSDGGYLDSGSQVRVLEIRNRRLVVAGQSGESS